MQSLKLPYMSDSLRQTAQEYKLLDNLSSSRDMILTEATLNYLDIYYNVKYMPDFCKERVVDNMKISINSFLQVGAMAGDFLYVCFVINRMTSTVIVVNWNI